MSKRKHAIRNNAARLLGFLLLTITFTAAAQDSARPTILNVPVSVTASVSPCPGESLRISGRMFLRFERALNEDGSTQLKMFTNLQGLNGQGQTSSTTYRFDNAGLEDQTLRCPAGEKCRSQIAHGFKLTGTGPSQNIFGFVITRIDEREDGVLQAKLERFDFVCHP